MVKATHAVLLSLHEEEADRTAAGLAHEALGLGAKCFYMGLSSAWPAIEPHFKELVRLPQAGKEALGFRPIIKSDEQWRDLLGEPQELPGLLLELLQEALEQNFSALWSINESGRLLPVLGKDRFQLCEDLVNRLILTQRPVVVVCRYTVESLDIKTLCNIVKLHPQVVVSGRFFENVFFREYSEEKDPMQAVVEKYTQEIDRERRKAEELEMLIAMVEHEIKNSLISIAGFSQLLQRKLARFYSKESSFYLERILANSIRLRAIADKMFHFIEAGGKFKVKEVDSGQVIEYVLKGLEDEIKLNKTKVVIEPPLPCIRTDETVLTFIFSNLIANAVHYSRAAERPRVEVSARPEGDFYIFRVSDNGIGIPEQDKDQVFELFKRSAEAKALHPYGAGMGLAITKRLVERAGGSIWFESEAGKGTTFYFRLPKKGPPLEAL